MTRQHEGIINFVLYDNRYGFVKEYSPLLKLHDEVF